MQQRKEGIFLKSNILRSLALCLTLALLCLSLVSCSEKVGAGHNDTTTVMKIGDYKVTMDQYRYVCFKIRDSYDGGDRNYWNQHPEAQEKFYADVLKELSAIYAIYSLAEEYDIELSDEEEEQLNEMMRGYIAPYGSEEAFLQAAEERHMTGDLVRMEIEMQMLQEKLYARLTDARSGVIASDDATVEAAISQGQYYCVRYVMLQNVKTDSASLAQNRNIIESIRLSVATGSDIKVTYQAALAVANQTTDVSYQLNSGDMTNGSYFILGYQNEKAENAVLALPNGGVSDVIDMGDYLIFYQRFATDSAYMAGAGFAELRTQLVQKKFSELCATRAAELRTDVKYKSAHNGAFSVTE